MVEYFMLNKALSNAKKVTDFEKFNDTKILIVMDDKLSDDITIERLWY